MANCDIPDKKKLDNNQKNIYYTATFKRQDNTKRNSDRKNT